MVQYLDSEGITNPDEKIATALGYISNDKEHTSRHFKHTMTAKYATIDKDWKIEIKYRTWDDFTLQFGKTFGDTEDKQEAAVELVKFRQGSLDIAEYISKFRELVGRSGSKGRNCPMPMYEGIN